MLDRGASICVSNLPTFAILADDFRKWSRSTPSNIDYKTLTVANKAEVCVLLNVILTLHTSILGLLALS